MPRILIVGPALLFLCFVQHEPGCGGIKLKDKAPFPVGVAINTEKLKNVEGYWEMALAHFDSYTPEKVMKQRYLHPKKDVYDFRETDNLVHFCKQRNIRLHGHALVWHKALPDWIVDFKGDRGAWDNLLKEYVQTVVKHCSHYVRSWDVVNEAFNDDGSLRKNVWLNNIGEDYIEKAFQYAREADPDARLFYNDYDLERNGPKLIAVLEYMGKIKERGIRVDGIGMQMHVSLNYPPIADINGAASRISNEGYLVHYSELDVTLGGQSIFKSRKKLLELQKKRIREIVMGYMALDPKARFGITVWGVGDADSWLTEAHARARPLLFDQHYRPKPGLCGFVEGLN